MEQHSSSKKDNPFTYGNPITDPARFVGRQREIEQVQSRLSNAEFESSSIVGERRIGKTSLLKYLAHSDVTRLAGFPEDKYIFIYLDLQMLDSTKTPTDFWQRVLQAIKRRMSNAALQASIDDVCREPAIDTFLLDDLFSLVDETDLHIVLLLDEFERVTQNENFDVDFFSGLRALAIHHHLALITSSRQELVELTHSKEVKDSPFFNIFANVNLRPFSEDESEMLIQTYLAGNEITFQSRDVGYILEIAGSHPYFLQMACSFLFEAYRQTEDTQLRRRFLNIEFREKAAPVFSDYWHHSPADQRVMLAIESLRHLERGGGVIGGDTLDQLKRLYGGAERTVLILEKRGLILAERGNIIRYRPFSLVFCDWISDELIARTGDETVWNKWKTGQIERLNKLPAEAKQRVLGLLPHLNSMHTDSIGDWLLSPSTVSLAIPLLENFLGNYQKYVSSRPVTLDNNLLFDSNMADSAPSLKEDNTRIQHLRRQLVIYTQNLNKLEEQEAQHGVFDVPLELQNKIEATKSKIEEINSELEDLSGM